MELWTVQAPVVLETLAREGVYRVKRAYVTEKYKETAWIFRTAYDAFVGLAEEKLPRPEGAEYPVWLFRDRSGPFQSPGAFLLRMEIPETEVLLFDAGSWNRILNLSYLGTEGEIAAFEEELRRCGVRHSGDVFQKPFYPVQRRKILESWKRLLLETPSDPLRTQAAAWVLKKDWIVEKIPL